MLSPLNLPGVLHYALLKMKTLLWSESITTEFLYLLPKNYGSQQANGCLCDLEKEMWQIKGKNAHRPHPTACTRAHLFLFPILGPQDLCEPPGSVRASCRGERCLHPGTQGGAGLCALPLLGGTAGGVSRWLMKAKVDTTVHRREPVTGAKSYQMVQFKQTVASFHEIFLLISKEKEW